MVQWLPIRPQQQECIVLSDWFSRQHTLCGLRADGRDSWEESGQQQTGLRAILVFFSFFHAHSWLGDACFFPLFLCYSFFFSQRKRKRPCLVDCCHPRRVLARALSRLDGHHELFIHIAHECSLHDPSTTGIGLRGPSLEKRGGKPSLGCGCVRFIRTRGARTQSYQIWRSFLDQDDDDDDDSFLGISTLLRII